MTFRHLAKCAALVAAFLFSSSALAENVFFDSRLITDCGYGTLDKRFATATEAGEWGASECTREMGQTVTFDHLENPDQPGTSGLCMERNGNVSCSYGSANAYYDSNLCPTAGEYWNPDTLSCDTEEWVDPDSCQAKAGTTATKEILMQDMDSIVPGSTAADGCKVTMVSSGAPYSYPPSTDVYLPMIVEYTGEDATGNDTFTTPPTDTPEPAEPFVDEVAPTWDEEFNEDMPEDGCGTNSSGETICVDARHHQKVENPSSTTEWDGNKSEKRSDHGETVSETVTETVTTHSDGSTTTVTETVTTNADGGTTTVTVTQSGVSRDDVPPTSDTTTTTKTTEKDPQGEITDETTDTEKDPDFGDGPSVDDVYSEGREQGEFDQKLLDLENAGTDDPEQITELSLDSLTFGASCVNPDPMTIAGETKTLDICPYINYAQVTLYWIFSLFTAVYVYITLTTLNRGVA